MLKLVYFATLLAIAANLFCCEPVKKETTETIPPQKPNVIIFYVDDLGYGDVSCYGAQAVTTPAIDRLAANGLKFTDAHSGAATCTPSRYTLLTGEYAFRNQAAVLRGDAPLLIDTARQNMAKLFKRAGYATAVIGKWHLGLGTGNPDWNNAVKPGPLELGFDYSFLIPATGDRVPTVYLEGHNVVGRAPNDPIQVSYQQKVGNRPTGHENPELLRYKADPQHSQTIVNGVSRIGSMAGGENALWVDEDFPDVFTQKAIDFIKKQQGSPFFLFFPFHDIHVPRLPNKRFEGKTNMGPRGDAIVQMDWMTGQIMEALQALGIEDNTLVVFTSDNGPVVNDGYEDGATERLGSHQPNGPWRGGKYSAFEAGTRVPTIAYWPNKIKAGVNPALLSQVDLYASLADMVGIGLLPGEAPDSESRVAAWMGQDTVGREYMLEEAYTLSLRKGPWKYIAPVPEEQDLRSWVDQQKHIESGLDRIPQLYNLDTDIAEMNNVAKLHPEIVQAMEAKLMEITKGSPIAPATHNPAADHNH